MQGKDFSGKVTRSEMKVPVSCGTIHIFCGLVSKGGAASEFMMFLLCDTRFHLHAWSTGIWILEELLLSVAEQRVGAPSASGYFKTGSILCSVPGLMDGCGPVCEGWAWETPMHCKSRDLYQTGRDTGRAHVVERALCQSCQPREHLLRGSER